MNEHELKILNELSKDGNITQRSLSEKTNISLGLVNLILKRLIRKGLIKTRGLNEKKLEYILTPKGFSEKAKKSYNYIVKTVNLVKAVKEEIAKIVLEEYNAGQKRFVVLGHDSLADIIELSLKGFDYQRVKNTEEIKDNRALILISDVDIKIEGGFRYINLAEKLGCFYWGVEEKT